MMTIFMLNRSSKRSILKSLGNASEKPI